MKTILERRRTFGVRHRWTGVVSGIAAVFLLTAPALLLAQRGHLVKAMNLAEMEQEAALIVEGRVTAVRIEPHPEFGNLRTALVTVEVRRVFKGQAGTSYTWREYLPDIRDTVGTLDYKIGDEYLLLMIRPSQYGLSSPSGQSQGVFRLKRDARGRRFLVNGRNNIGLFQDLETQAPGLARQLPSQARNVVATHRQGPVAFEQIGEILSALSRRAGQVAR